MIVAEIDIRVLQQSAQRCDVVVTDRCIITVAGFNCAAASTATITGVSKTHFHVVLPFITIPPEDGP